MKPGQRVKLRDVDGIFVVESVFGMTALVRERDDPSRHWQFLIEDLDPVEDDGREFDGFCAPCGGFRKHRLGCPARRGTFITAEDAVRAWSGGRQ